MQFTTDQQAAMDSFHKFLANEKEKFMIIQGAAGSGKSTLIKHLVEASHSFCEMMSMLLKDKNVKYTVELAATTNPAVAVMEDLTGLYATTIHSLLGLGMRNNFRTGEKQLFLKRDAEALKDRLLIIDEGSMIDSTLFQFIDDQTVNCKVVIIGDQFQLAPVKEENTVMETMTNIIRAEMNQIMRNSGIIKSTGAEFRKTVEKLSLYRKMTPDFTAYRNKAKTKGTFPSIPNGHAELAKVDGPTFKRLVDAAFTNPSHHPFKAKVVAWTNRRVMEYNKHIRGVQGYPEEFTLGEKVITNKPILSGMHVSIDTAVEITGIGPRFEHDNHAGVFGRIVEINGRHQEFFPEDADMVKSLLRRLAKGKEWTEYFRIKDNWLDLRAPHACTVHKAQGASYDTVFIDLADIGRCTIPSDVARMMYVAISRARHQVYFYGSLPSAYGG